MKIVDGCLAKYIPSVIGGSAITILIASIGISAWIIPSATGFFRFLIGRVFDDVCASFINSDKDVVSCTFLGRPGLRFLSSV